MISVEDLRAKIREIPDYPKQGLVFQDLSLLFADPDCFRTVIELLADWARPRRPQIVLGAEERGFILGGALAHELGAGFVAARQAGVLGSEPVSPEWELEGGPGSLELPIEALPAGTRVLVHDDLLATGATAQAKVELVEELGAEVIGILFVVEIELLDGRRRLAGHEVHSLIRL
ncbi:MAG: adenine phosphoribosyltransferase [Gaiellaceae bacterium]